VRDVEGEVEGMEFAVQATNVSSLREAVKSSCSSIRFGSEFCEHLLPSLGMLQAAYAQTHQAGKEFTYVTPRLSNAGIERLQKHLSLLSELGQIHVVVNDLGALQSLKDYPNLFPHLGRHLLMVPSRSPWVESVLRSQDTSSDRGQWARELYSTTSLNYAATMKLYRSQGCQRVDADWIPRVFPSLAALVENGFRVSLHLYLLAVTFTRRCHTARYLGEENLERCSMPCLSKAFLLRNEVLEAVGVDFFLHGNAVFRMVDPSAEEVAEAHRSEISELVIPMNPLSKIDNSEKIDRLISSLS
jgi:hypothetical protein